MYNPVLFRLSLLIYVFVLILLEMFYFYNFLCSALLADKPLSYVFLEYMHLTIGQYIIRPLLANLSLYNFIRLRLNTDQYQLYSALVVNYALIE